MIQTYIAEAGQNIVDICLMTYGTLDKLYKLVGDNDFGSINNYPYQGQLFKWDDTLVFNQAVNISNTQAGVNYATRSSSTGNIEFNIQSNGLPVSGQPIVTPTPPPNPADSIYDYYLVFNTDARWDNGSQSFTDPYLVGKSGYAVYAQQNAGFFSVTQNADLNYNSATGTFTVLTEGFSLIDDYYLVVYPNKYNTTIP